MRQLLSFFGIFFLTLILSCKEAYPVVEAFFETPTGKKSPVLSLEVAKTESARSVGLMYRKELGEHTGMIFIFPDEAERSFWMKNTYLELDIIFLDKELRVINIAAEAKPLSTTSKKSIRPAKYVVEIQGGMAQKWGIIPGAVLSVPGNSHL